ncbi:GNAT family N-acetyltransferase [Streptomyces sp. WMMC1477]|uniref:GNAT family N-acetyltransferase n=1 Tax=Streptomyces sp. WMMC1477 TaxID=3015155 RepID=UPI0022B710C3|nr:GNAT family N-acetyltransferase [Streptomyces sp. WMMC1477]MCZ7434069.1 GNAT family N-acetyltransferase [Streptomyces sp. WMMC1477]
MPSPEPTVTESGDRGDDDTLDLELPPELLATAPGTGTAPAAGSRSASEPASEPASGPVTAPGELIGAVDRWPPVDGPFGTFQLVPVRPERDLPLLGAWMNDPDVAAYWGLAGDPDATARHLRAQLEGDGRSVPCLGVLDGTPMSYWELYRADLDPLARHFPTRPHDTGIRLLIGPAEYRGRGLGAALLRAVAELVLGRRPACRRVLAEPDVRNAASVAAFLRAGFRLAAEVDLPDKRAALVVRERPGHRAP